MPLKYTDIIGRKQQVISTFIRLVWERKELWEITSSVHHWCWSDWIAFLLLLMHCTLFILILRGLNPWLKEMLFRVSTTQVRKLKELLMNSVRNSLFIYFPNHFVISRFLICHFVSIVINLKYLFSYPKILFCLKKMAFILFFWYSWQRWHQVSEAAFLYRYETTRKWICANFIRVSSLISKYQMAIYW